MISKPPPGDILLVEDDPLLAATTQRGLDRLSLPVRLAESCAQAIDAWDTMRPRAVLMDYRLPDGFGTDVIHRMRRRGRDEPVFCMTAESESLSAATRQTLNISRVLTKPVLPSAIAAAFDSLLPPATRRSEVDRMPRCIGRFRVISPRGGLTASKIVRLSRAARTRDWLVVDVSAMLTLDDPTVRAVCAWAAWLSAHGGRLCLFIDDAARRAGVAKRVGHGVDVFSDRHQLASQGLRLTGRGERQRLLAQAEPRDQED